MVDLDTMDWGRASWIGFGAVLGLAFLAIVWRFVGTFVFGIFIYYSTRNYHRRIARYVRYRTVSALLSLFLLALPALLLIGYTVAIGIQQLNTFTTSQSANLGPYADALSRYVGLSQIAHNPQDMETVRQTIDAALGYLGLVGTIVLHVFVMFSIAFYLLRDDAKLRRWLSTFSDDRNVLDRYASAVDRSLERIFYGNILNAIMTGVIGAFSYSVLTFVQPDALQIPYPALVGLLAGVTSLIPVIGMKLVYIPVAGYLAYLASLHDSGWWFVGLFVLVSAIVVDAIPDFLIRPYVSSGDLHVGLLMLAYILGPLLFGWYGLFLGPILLALFVHFARIVLPELIAGEPIRPYAVDPSVVVHSNPYTGVDPSVGSARETPEKSEKG